MHDLAHLAPHVREHTPRSDIHRVDPGAGPTGGGREARGTVANGTSRSKAAMVSQERHCE